MPPAMERQPLGQRGIRSWPPAAARPLLLEHRSSDSSSSSSAGSSDFLPLPVQRAISDPVQSPLRDRASFREDLRRTQSWPPLGAGVGLPIHYVVTERILVEPFHDKARARVRAVEGGPVISRCTFALWVVVGASGWWSTNAITAQLPLLAEVLPEKKALGNKLSAMGQGGNLFLVAYMLLRRYVQMDPSAVIFSMMLLGCASLGGCALFWDCLLLSDESLPLLALAVIAGGVGCTSSVTYWTFLLLYPPRCTIAASVGMSLGGVVVNLLSAVQLCGVRDGGARFGPSVFFVITAALQGLGMVCFFLVRSSKDEDRGDVHEPLSPQEGFLGRWAGISHSEVAEEEPPDPLKGKRAGFCSLNFLVRGVTYLMPTIMPYVAGAYPELRMQLLFWMLLGQQMGETAGRALEPSPCGAAAVGGCAVLVFAAFAAAAISPLVVSSWLPQAYAQLLIPVACMFYFLSYGMIETAIFKWIRGLSIRSEEVEDISAMTGSCGQMGSLTSTYLVFLFFELRAGQHQ